MTVGVSQGLLTTRTQVDFAIADVTTRRPWLEPSYLDPVNFVLNYSHSFISSNLAPLSAILVCPWEVSIPPVDISYVPDVCKHIRMIPVS